MHFAFSNKILPLEAALISAGSRPPYWRSVYNFQNLVKRVEGNQDGNNLTNRNMDQPTPGCMEWKIYIINYRIKDNNIILFKCLRYVQSMDRQVHCLTGCWELRKMKQIIIFFSIPCVHGTNKTLKKWNTRVGTLKEKFEEFMSSGLQNETSTLRRKEYKDSVIFHSSQRIRPFILPWN